jgi:hypothetical protein
MQFSRTFFFCFCVSKERERTVFGPKLRRRKHSGCFQQSNLVYSFRVSKVVRGPEKALVRTKFLRQL